MMDMQMQQMKWERKRSWEEVLVVKHCLVQGLIQGQGLSLNLSLGLTT